MKIPEWAPVAIAGAALGAVLFGPRHCDRDAAVVPTAEPTASAAAPTATVMASLYASYRALSDRRGELARERPDATDEDEELRLEEGIIVDLMRQEAAHSPEVPPAVESILAEQR